MVLFLAMASSGQDPVCRPLWGLETLRSGSLILLGAMAEGAQKLLALDCYLLLTTVALGVDVENPEADLIQ